MDEKIKRATRIKEMRERRGLTIEALSEKVGVSRSTLSRYESGSIKKVPHDVMVKVADELKTTAEYLDGTSDSPDQREKEKEPEVIYFDVDVSEDGVTYAARSNKSALDAEYKMLSTLYFMLTSQNRLKVVEMMQKLLMEQKGGIL